MLIQSVVAGAHLASEHQGRFETPHIHIDGPHFDHDQLDNDQYQKKHHQNSHIHFHYDLTQGADLAVSTTQQPELELIAWHNEYLGLSHRPAVPPPTH